jgi:hypothetical protein
MIFVCDHNNQGDKGGGELSKSLHGENSGNDATAVFCAGELCCDDSAKRI